MNRPIHDAFQAVQASPELKERTRAYLHARAPRRPRYRSLLAAAACLLVVIAAAMTTGTVISPAPETVISTPLGDLIGLFQERFPRCSRIFCGSLLLLTGILCGRLAVRYGLYPVSSTLTIPLYGLVACGILLGREYLTESVTAFILLLSTQSFFACFRNGYAIGAVFRASFFLGLLPLLYAPLLPLPLLILAAAFCFRRTLREVFVSLCGVILPFLAVCYVAWGQGANPVDIPVGLWHSFVSDSGYRIFANTPPLVPAILGIVLFIVLCAVFFGLISFRAISIKARGMLTYTILLFTVTGSLMAVPSVTPGLLAVAAVPAALLMPLTFIRIQRTVGTLLYLVLYFVCIANILQ